MKIVCVDDDTEILMYYQNLFSKCNWDIKTFSNPIAAAKYLKNTRLDPDIILLDVQMPVLNGVELAKLIRIKYTDIPILFVTGSHYARVNINNCRVLSKGTSSYQLLESIKQLTGKR